MGADPRWGTSRTRRLGGTAKRFPAASPRADLSRKRLAPRLLGAPDGALAAEVGALAAEDGANLDPFRAWAAMTAGEKAGRCGGLCVAVGALGMALRDRVAVQGGVPCVDKAALAAALQRTALRRAALRPPLGVALEHRRAVAGAERRAFERRCSAEAHASAQCRDEAVAARRKRIGATAPGTLSNSARWPHQRR